MEEESMDGGDSPVPFPCRDVLSLWEFAEQQPPLSSGSLQQRKPLAGYQYLSYQIPELPTGYNNSNIISSDSSSNRSRNSSSETPSKVLFVIVDNPLDEVIEHKVVFSRFSGFGGEIEQILIFSKKQQWRFFVDMDSMRTASVAKLALNETLLRLESSSELRMRVQFSTQPRLHLRNNNPGGINYKLLNTKFENSHLSYSTTTSASASIPATWLAKKVAQNSSIQFQFNSQQQLLYPQAQGQQNFASSSLNTIQLGKPNEQNQDSMSQSKISQIHQPVDNQIGRGDATSIVRQLSAGGYSRKVDWNEVVDFIEEDQERFQIDSNLKPSRQISNFIGFTKTNSKAHTSSGSRSTSHTYSASGMVTSLQNQFIDSPQLSASSLSFKQLDAFLRIESESQGQIGIAFSDDDDSEDGNDCTIEVTASSTDKSISGSILAPSKSFLDSQRSQQITSSFPGKSSFVAQKPFNQLQKQKHQDSTKQELVQPTKVPSMISSESQWKGRNSKSNFQQPLLNESISTSIGIASSAIVATSMGQFNGSTYVRQGFMEESRPSRVLYVNRLSSTEVNARHLYNVFSNFGDILRIVIKRAKHAAFIEYVDQNYATRAKDCMDKKNLFDSEIRVFYSHFESLTQQQLQPGESENNEILFVGSDASHRFAKDKKMVVNSPTLVIHVSNLKQEVCDHEKVVEMFKRFGQIDAIHLEKIPPKFMCHVKFRTLKAALLAVAQMHNHEVRGRKIQLSFSRKKLEQIHPNDNQSSLLF